MKDVFKAKKEAVKEVRNSYIAGYPTNIAFEACRQAILKAIGD